jgi:hypothetical protein
VQISRGVPDSSDAYLLVGDGSKGSMSTLLHVIVRATFAIPAIQDMWDALQWAWMT